MSRLLPFCAGSQTWQGFIPEIWDELSKEMGFSYTIHPNPSMDFLTANASNWPYDAGIIDSSVPEVQSIRMADTWECTTAFLDSSAGAMVLKTTQVVGLFRLFDPFTGELWGAIVGTIFAAAFLLVLLNMLAPSQEFARLSLRQRLPSCESSLMSVYHMFAAALGGEDYEITWEGRLLRIAILFFVLIIASSYTANLAAFLNSSPFTVWGPRNIDELRDSRACFTTDQEEARFGAFVKSSVSAGPMMAMSFLEGKEFCHQALRNGQADVWIHPYESLKMYLMDNCGDLELVENIRILPNTWGFILKAEQRHLAANLSAALGHFKQQAAY
ncbi:unnamed protein product [Polarella glacialis]|uniref:Ionotropic glutamate receptor C-terminal domain-containing protein n=1 Tax=Polarella glacialis TaxID=89957 RepID=A0A813I281_POLGL|nr:unnamed protein product [Polarella glacialis]